MSILTPKKLILFGLVAILLIAIPITVYLVGQQQDLRGRAAPSTTLAFQPTSKTVEIGQDVTFDIIINPNSNFVSFVHLIIAYDPTKLEKSGDGLTINTNAFPGFDSTKPPVPTFDPTGKITVDLAVGANPTAFIQNNNTKVGTLTLKAIASTQGTTTPITFDSETQVLTGQGDQFNTNVLSSTIPASVTISETATISPTLTPIPTSATTPTPTSGVVVTPTPSCQVPSVVSNVKVEYPSCEGSQCSFEQASCSWDALTGATSYAVKISQTESGEVVRNDTATSSTTKVVFSVVQNKTYQCDISAVNSCGTGPAGTHSLLCAVEGVELTPTPVPTSTPEPTIIAQITPIPTSAPAPTTPPAVATPTIPPSGPGEIIIGIGALGIILSIIGGVFLFII